MTKRARRLPGASEIDGENGKSHPFKSKGGLTRESCGKKEQTAPARSTVGLVKRTDSATLTPGRPRKMNEGKGSAEK